jgi:hypothetical protein
VANERLFAAGGPELDGAVVEEASAPAGEGAAILVVRIPTDAALGTWTATASCLDANGAVVDGPVTSTTACKRR